MKNPRPLFTGVVLLSLMALPATLPGATGPATILIQPQPQTIFVGDPVTFSVTADGTEPFTYQWYRNGNAIGGATGAAYTIAATVLSDDGASFQVAVTNALGGVVSDPAELRIDGGIWSTNTITLLPFNASWRYNEANANLGTTWKDIGYNDTVAGWSSGAGVLDADTSPRTSIGGQTVGTQLKGGNPLGSSDYPTIYFRTHFNYNPGSVVSINLIADVLVDDAVLLYLNGQNWFGTDGLSFGALFSDWSTFTVGDASVASYYPSAAALVNGDNLVAAEAHNRNATSSDITFGLEVRAEVVTRVRDTVAPAVSYIPAANSTVRSLPQIEVRFDEGVQGVDAADLLINGAAATELLNYGPDQYVFRFPTPPTGSVQVAWASGHGITDLSANTNAFAGGAFTYVLDPNAQFSDIRINEIVAANDNGAVDEDGDTSDWIEIHNGGSTAVDLAGWYLTDNILSLNKWRFPSVSLPANGYLIVWASEKNRSAAGAPLHTNFKLEKNGEFLALVLPDGTNVVSSFSPYYPVQFDDISYGCDRIDPSLHTYFSTPTPGALNSATSAGYGVGPEVRFSRESGTFRTAFNLELSVDDPNFVIRYYLVTNASTAATVDVPSASSPLYTGPIPVRLTTQVRARAYPTAPGYYAGPASSETFIMIDAGAAGFTSDLPLVIWHNFGAGTPPASVTSAGAVGVFMVFDTNNPSGLASLTNPPVVATRAGAHIRGASTEGYAKKNLGIEFWTEVNRDDRDLEVLDMPADSDWVLYAPNQFDRNYLHNPLAFALGRQLGHWAPRTRFAEFFFNTGGGTVTYPSEASGNYNGVYVLMEKIKANNDRLDIARLDPQDTNTVTITGGYCMKIDRNNDLDDVNNFTPGSWPSTRFSWITANHAGWNTQPIIFHDPDGIVIGQRPLQRSWFISYINQFESALTSLNWTNPVTGYRAYIDEDQWIENHMLNTFPFNVDGYRLSGYFYKERDEAGLPGSGKLKQGALWDFDRSQGTGNVDPRPFNPRQWKRPISGDQGTDLFGNNDNTTGTRLGVRWFWQVFHDPDFWQRWVDRWQELRENGIYTTSNVLATIDILANQVRQAQPRNAKRWTSGDSIGTPNTGTHSADGYSHTFTGTYQGDVDFLKKWWTDRLHFVETNFLSRPAFSSAGGQVPAGYVVTLTAPGAKAGTTIYYTLDGTDPRLPGGHVSPSALSGTAPVNVAINQNARIFARNRNLNHRNLTNASLTAVGGNPPLSTPWSGTRIDTFYIAEPDLRITEIMYHPADPPPGNMTDTGNFEYIEVQNIGATPLNVNRFRLRGGIEFDFPNLLLSPGQYAVVVKDLSAFSSRYNTAGITIAGVFTNSLANNGDHIVLEGGLREPIHDFDYSDEWYPVTDGPGFALQIVDAHLPLQTLVEGTNTSTWGLKSSWRPSGAVHGSPGAADPGEPAILPVYVNEAMSHTDLPVVDAVELYNPNPVAVDLTGWFLSDSFATPRKYRIPGGEIPAFGYRVFYESNSFGLGAFGFGLSATGDDIYLFSGDMNTNLTGYYHGFDFGAQAKNATFGRWVISTGNDHFPTQIAPSLGATNAGPLVGPVIISEVMYHPPDPATGVDDSFNEYIELHNLGAIAAPLYDPLHATNTFKLQDAVEYTFPMGVSLPAGGHLLVVSFDPNTNATQTAEFRARNIVPPDIPLYGPWDGKLDNSSDGVELMRPDLPDAPPSPTAGYVPYLLAERVRYSDVAPWPSAADGIGLSLQRIDAAAYGNDPANWIAAGPGPGQQFQGGSPPEITTQPVSLNVLEGETASFTVSVTGAGPFSYLWRKDGANFGGPNSPTLTFAPVVPEDQGTYCVIVLGAAGAVTSSNATLVVRPLPVIQTHPASFVVSAGSNITFSVSATGTGPLFYQWRRNGQDISGATSSSYTVVNAQWDVNDGHYTVVVTDSNGSRESEPGALSVKYKPVITQQPEFNPANSNVLEGRTFSLTISADGNFPMGFRFRSPKDQYFAILTFYSNHNTATLVVENAKSNLHAGGWDVGITNSGGSTLSRKVYLTVTPAAPYFAVHPASQQAAVGTNVLLSSEARGTDPIGYQWYF
ncbi:MAG: lamin tail domain-containing protein, partial [Verrucomicrobia bacterium]|nr:lamin tail domain-containing protein [Verrucomicrobiota bacterium]